MNDRFVSFLMVSQWASAIVALMYHLRTLLFVDYQAVSEKNIFSKAFYALTGLGHESFAVFLVLDGLVSGMIMRRCWAGTPIDRAAFVEHLGALYRIILPCLVLGAVFDIAGVQFFNRHGVYSAFPELGTVTLSLSSLFGNAFNMQPFIVPNFGSNSMLYLLSYLFWFSILLLLFARAGTLEGPRRLYARAALSIMVVLVMPYKFLVWGAIWYSGVLVAALSEARNMKPGTGIALILFACALVLSRSTASDSSVLPEHLKEGILEGKFLLVGMSFALLARALYPEAGQGVQDRLVRSVTEMRAGRSGLAASFTFYFHFPVIMLLVAAATSVLDWPLMQQPTLTRYAEFACLVAVSVCSEALVARAVAGATKRRLVGRGSCDSVP